jgi:hypothetical protein
MPRHTQSNERTLYFVECDFGKAGLAFVERSPADMDRKTTVADIAANQWSADVVKVLAVTPGDFSAEDVTEEILADAGLVSAEHDNPSPVDLRAIRWDHDRDILKHEERV